MLLFPNTTLTDIAGIKLKFDGQTHQIDANTLINCLIHFSTIIQQVNQDLEPSVTIDVRKGT